MAVRLGAVSVDKLPLTSTGNRLLGRETKHSSVSVRVSPFPVHAQPAGHDTAKSGPPGLGALAWQSAIGADRPAPQRTAPPVTSPRIDLNALRAQAASFFGAPSGATQPTAFVPAGQALRAQPQPGQRQPQMNGHVKGAGPAVVAQTHPLRTGIPMGPMAASLHAQQGEQARRAVPQPYPADTRVMGNGVDYGHAPSFNELRARYESQRAMIGTPNKAHVPTLESPRDHAARQVVFANGGEEVGGYIPEVIPLIAQHFPARLPEGLVVAPLHAQEADVADYDHRIPSAFRPVVASPDPAADEAAMRARELAEAAAKAARAEKIKARLKELESETRRRNLRKKRPQGDEREGDALRAPARRGAPQGGRRGEDEPRRGPPRPTNGARVPPLPLNGGAGRHDADTPSADSEWSDDGDDRPADKRDAPGRGGARDNVRRDGGESNPSTDRSVGAEVEALLRSDFEAPMGNGNGNHDRAGGARGRGGSSSSASGPAEEEIGGRKSTSDSSLPKDKRDGIVKAPRPGKRGAARPATAPAPKAKPPATRPKTAAPTRPAKAAPAPTPSPATVDDDPPKEEEKPKKPRVPPAPRRKKDPKTAEELAAEEAEKEREREDVETEKKKKASEAREFMEKQKRQRRQKEKESEDARHKKEQKQAETLKGLDHYRLQQRPPPRKLEPGETPAKRQPWINIATDAPLDQDRATEDEKENVPLLPVDTIVASVAMAAPAPAPAPARGKPATAKATRPARGAARGGAATRGAKTVTGRVPVTRPEPIRPQPVAKQQAAVFDDDIPQNQEDEAEDNLRDHRGASRSDDEMPSAPKNHSDGDDGRDQADEEHDYEDPPQRPQRTTQQQPKKQPQQQKQQQPQQRGQGRQKQVTFDDGPVRPASAMQPRNRRANDDRDVPSERPATAPARGTPARDAPPLRPNKAWSDDRPANVSANASASSEVDLATAARLEALREMAKTLQDRLKHFTSAELNGLPLALRNQLNALHRDGLLDGLPGWPPPADTQPAPQTTNRPSARKNVSASRRGDFDDMSANQIGVSSLATAASERNVHDSRQKSATTIQAMWRGHNVRKRVGPQSNVGRGHRRQREQDEDDAEEETRAGRTRFAPTTRGQASARSERAGSEVMEDIPSSARSDDSVPEDVPEARSHNGRSARQDVDASGTFSEMIDSDFDFGERGGSPHVSGVGSPHVMPSPIVPVKRPHVPPLRDNAPLLTATSGPAAPAPYSIVELLAQDLAHHKLAPTATPVLAEPPPQERTRGVQSPPKRSQPTHPTTKASPKKSVERYADDFEQPSARTSARNQSQQYPDDFEPTSARTTSARNQSQVYPEDFEPPSARVTSFNNSAIIEEDADLRSARSTSDRGGAARAPARGGRAPAADDQVEEDVASEDFEALLADAALDKEVDEELPNRSGEFVSEDLNGSRVSNVSRKHSKKQASDEVSYKSDFETPSDARASPAPSTPQAKQAGAASGFAVPLQGFGGVFAEKQGQEGGRLSPNSLARTLMAELNLLEKMEQGHLELAQWEQQRHLVMAQQETVALATILQVERERQAQAEREAHAAAEQKRAIDAAVTAALAARGITIKAPARGQPASEYADSFEIPTPSEVSRNGSATPASRAGRGSDRSVGELPLDSDRSIKEELPSPPRRDRNASRTSVLEEVEDLTAPKRDRNASRTSVLEEVEDLTTQKRRRTPESDDDRLEVDRFDDIDDEIEEAIDEALADAMSSGSAPAAPAGRKTTAPAKPRSRSPRRSPRRDDEGRGRAGGRRSPSDSRSRSNSRISQADSSSDTERIVSRMLEEEERRATDEEALISVREREYKKRLKSEMKLINLTREKEGRTDLQPAEKTRLMQLALERAEIEKLRAIAKAESLRHRALIAEQQQAITRARADRTELRQRYVASGLPYSEESDVSADHSVHNERTRQDERPRGRKDGGRGAGRGGDDDAHSFASVPEDVPEGTPARGTTPASRRLDRSGDVPEDIDFSVHSDIPRAKHTPQKGTKDGAGSKHGSEESRRYDADFEDESVVSERASDVSEGSVRVEQLRDLLEQRRKEAEHLVARAEKDRKKKERDDEKARIRSELDKVNQIIEKAKAGDSTAPAPAKHTLSPKSSPAHRGRGAHGAEHDHEGGVSEDSRLYATAATPTHPSPAPKPAPREEDGGRSPRSPNGRSPRGSHKTGARPSRSPRSPRSDTSISLPEELLEPADASDESPRRVEVPIVVAPARGSGWETDDVSPRGGDRTGDNLDQSGRSERGRGRNGEVGTSPARGDNESDDGRRYEADSFVSASPSSSMRAPSRTDERPASDLGGLDPAKPASGLGVQDRNNVSQVEQDVEDVDFVEELPEEVPDDGSQAGSSAESPRGGRLASVPVRHAQPNADAEAREIAEREERERREADERRDREERERRDREDRERRDREERERRDREERERREAEERDRVAREEKERTEAEQRAKEKADAEAAREAERVRAEEDARTRRDAQQRLEQMEREDFNRARLEAERDRERSKIMMPAGPDEESEGAGVEAIEEAVSEGGESEHGSDAGGVPVRVVEPANVGGEDANGSVVYDDSFVSLGEFEGQEPAKATSPKPEPKTDDAEKKWFRGPNAEREKTAADAVVEELIDDALEAIALARHVKTQDDALMKSVRPTPESPPGGTGGGLPSLASAPPLGGSAPAARPRPEPPKEPGIANGAEYVKGYIDKLISHGLQMAYAGDTGVPQIPLEAFMTIERAAGNAEYQQVHNKLVFDAANEALVAVQPLKGRAPVYPWSRNTRDIASRLSKPLEGAALADKVADQVGSWLRNPAGRAAPPPNAPSLSDNIESLLSSDVRAKEEEWVNYDEEEIELKYDLSDRIFDTLLEDTIGTLDIVAKRKRGV